MLDQAPWRCSPRHSPFLRVGRRPVPMSDNQRFAKRPLIVVLSGAMAIAGESQLRGQCDFVPEQAKLVDGILPAVGNNFGNSVDVKGDWAIVGSRQAAPRSSSQGA